MKSKIAFLILLGALAGCESEVDKCVEANLLSRCLGDKSCVKEKRAVMEGQVRYYCLSAAGGKK